MQQTAVVELQGVAVSRDAADDTPVAEGAPIEPRPSSLANSASNLDSIKKDPADTSQGANAGCGCATLIFLIIFLVNGGMEAKCDRPLPLWLLVNVILGFSLFGVGCAVTCFVRFYASTLGTSDDQTPVRKPTKLGQICLALLGLGPIATFVLYVDGNIQLWSTFPSANATLAEPTSDGTLADGLGCAPDLYWALRGYMVFTFVVMGLILPLACCACCAACCASSLGQ